ncbi:MAG TPA: amidase family protein, partial [Actinomycetota bacterium]
VKDNIDVAGIPTTNGATLPPFVPTADAIVVERVLGGGGRIVGKLNMDAFGVGSTGETSGFGPTRNPWDPRRSAGGSSGGAGAAVAAGEVDGALGVDQAGSARIPASFCGVVAIKPTIGTVPTGGVTHIDRSVDSVCPMSRTVAGASQLLSVIAGPDPRDGGPDEPSRELDLVEATARGVRGLRIAVIDESLAGAQPAVQSRLRVVAEGLSGAGAVVDHISVPILSSAIDIARGLLCFLGAATLRAWGEGTGHLAAVDPDRLAAMEALRRDHGDAMPLYMKFWLVADAHLRATTGAVGFATLQNLRVRVRRDLDEALSRYDALMTPTTPATAPLLGGSDDTPGRIARESVELIANTCAFNLSGHPAVAVPSGIDDSGLPSSAQVIGRWFDEATTIRVAGEVERIAGPIPHPPIAG